MHLVYVFFQDQMGGEDRPVLAWENVIINEAQVPSSQLEFFFSKVAAKISFQTFNLRSFVQNNTNWTNSNPILR